MTAIISYLAQCCSCFSFSAEQSQMQEIHIEWPHIIKGDQVTLHFVTAERNEHFQAMCSMYKIEPEALSEELGNMALWCICDEANRPIGAIQIDRYSSLSDLKRQVSDEGLAEELFNQNRTFEISYALDEPHRGRGLGSKAVKTWVDEALYRQYGKYVFAVVSADNKPSSRILEKNAFHYNGSYVHDKTNENTLLYTL
jgi:RimJ/RimL family protein N-acetyltransferase